MKQAETVYVGLSGGVDSSVAALRLIRAGYNVVGVFIKVWHPDWLMCDWEAERLDAMRVAAHLGIPFLTCDAVDAYRDEVAAYFISEYKAGRTPNPDVMCNQQVKFGAFLRFAIDRGADYIATGHYAQKVSAQGSDQLVRGIDEEKDQTYFLWTLTPDQLERTLLPVGDTKKETIREEAAKASIPTAAKKDSQGVCFLGQIDIPEFLSHYIDLVPGKVVNTDGETIGTHQGAFVYTLGQRHGFTIENINTARSPHYVVSKNVETNTVTVAAETPKLPPHSKIILTQCNWIPGEPVGESVEVQFRYRQKPLRASLKTLSAGKAELSLEENTDKPAAGQSCVVYRGNECLGGGIIT